MYISKVKIRNYRNYEDFSIELKPFVTIIGENNIGKSNLLNAIYLIMSHDISVYRKRKLEVEDINFNAIQKFKKDIIEKEVEDIDMPIVSIDLYFLDPNKDQETVINDCWFDFKKKEARISYIYEFKSKRREEDLKRLKDTVNIKRAEGLNDSQILKYIDFPITNYEYEIVCGEDDKPLDNYWLNMLKMEYLDGLRDAKTELTANSSSKLLYKILSDRQMDEYANIKEQMVLLDEAIKKDEGVLETLKNDISQYLDRISLKTENSSNKVAFQFGSIELSEVLKKIAIQYGDDAISIDRNGLGRNNLLYIAVVLAHLYKKKHEYFRIIGIEEPEAHLCPILQRHLAKNIYDNAQSDEQQVIITTHSTHIASFLDLDYTCVLYKRGESVLNHYLVKGLTKSAEDIKTKRYLQKWLNATNSTMFYSQRVIFVEGIAEQILIPIFYEYEYGQSLDSINCQVVNVNGVAFSHFLKIVKNGYFVKSAVITDSDMNTHTENRAQSLKKQYESEVIKIFVSADTTFEKDILVANKSSAVKKRYVLSILSEVRPRKCNDKFREEQESVFDIKQLFECIEEYKSEFAFELAEKLGGENKKEKFSIPSYIKNTFEFINE